MEGTMTFGKMIRQARKARKLTQQQLADLVGVSKMTIRRYETDMVQPMETIPMRICKELDITINERSMNMCNNDNCEKKVKEAMGEEDLRFFLDGHIDEYEGDVVTVPRKEYDDLIADSTILRVVERMVESDAFSSYSLGEYLKEILSIRKPEPTPGIPDMEIVGHDEEASE